jgi:hypothetical protein
MSILDTALMAKLDEVLGGLSENDKAAFFDALRLSAESAKDRKAVSPEDIQKLSDSCDDWAAVQQALTTFQQIAAQMA